MTYNKHISCHFKNSRLFSSSFISKSRTMSTEEITPVAMNYIPEVVLKKRKNNEQWAINRKLQLQERVKRQKFAMFIKKPEQFIREFRDKELDFVRMKSRVKRMKPLPAAKQSKLLFVVRIGGKNDMHPRTRKILYSLRLRKIFQGVFLKADDSVVEMLQKVEPYVTYGYPSYKSVKDLIYKKGVVKVDKQKMPLTDNNIVEKELGEHDIICIEDIVSEIAKAGPNFKVVTNFLCPFLLNNPEKALQGKKRFTDGGDSGNREDCINELINKMN